jgi:sec-independent protein translocase protein TatA
VFADVLTPTHILILLLVFVALFGAKRLPDVARGLGQSARVLRAELNGLQHHGEGKQPETGSADKEPTAD